MLGGLTDYGEKITLVPQSGVQFVEYGFDVREQRNFSRAFIERVDPSANGSSEVEHTLLPNWNEEDAEAEPPHELQDDDDEYTAGTGAALKTFLDTWIPVPFLRIKPGADAYGNERYEDGPFDWVRMRITETRAAHGDTQASHRIVFAFDTTLLERVPNRPYLGISPEDASQEEGFRFVHKLAHVSKFLSSMRAAPNADGPTVDDQGWLRAWLESIFREQKHREKKRALRPDDFPHTLEHVALYIVLLGYVAQVASPARIVLADTVSEGKRTPIDVDLVLDIGNSRTCGLLIQSFPNDSSVDLNRSLVLELRDLGNPVLSYKEPFESQVELVHAEFGPEHLAAKSQRSRGFFWPSLVRLGPEAARYRSEAEGTEAVTGLSSPKRYLWDTDPVKQAWQFRGMQSRLAQPLIERRLNRFVNERGDVIEQLREDQRTMRLKVNKDEFEGAEQLRYSRSSFFTMMLLEIIAQALLKINSPDARQRDMERDAPRRLRSIVLTIPSATPVQEQRIIRSRAEAAVKLYWSLMGWGEETPGVPRRPIIHTGFDEASAVHLVYLYGEITQKLGGSISTLLDVIGKPRRGKPPPPSEMNGAGGDEAGAAGAADTLDGSLRIASVDVGGGTTDLMITTYYQYDDRALVPVQNFREGFRRAGDDLVKLVVERAILPAIEAHLKSEGALNAHELLKSRFDNSPQMSEADKHLRRQFVQRYLKPVALGILAECEGAGREASPSDRAFASFFGDPERQFAGDHPILRYLQGYIASHTNVELKLAEVIVPISIATVEDCVRSTFASVFDNIADAIFKFDADVVLLTGRPSCLPSLISQFRETQAVPADRVIAMRDLRVGNWYPFREFAQNVIGDPKTTAAVGGMLCSLASGQLTNFTLLTDRLQMTSTARFVGEMRQDGVIEDQKLYFSDVDLDEDEPTPMEADVTFYTPVQIGYRQLPREDWVASPLYRLRLVSGEHRDVARPIRVTLERSATDLSEDASQLEIMNSEAMREEFRISAAEDANGRPVKKKLELKFDTSAAGSDGTYWLDSGILTP